MQNKHFRIEENSDRSEDIICTLCSVWERSVKATHHFLTQDDIKKLVPFVKEGLSHIQILMIAYSEDIPVAFMGIEQNKIEMLFAEPQFFGKGIGKQLVTLGIKKYHISEVDVNEQNPKALQFYLHMGFKITERTDKDEQGNPFPILKMALENSDINEATISDTKK